MEGECVCALHITQIARCGRVVGVWWRMRVVLGKGRKLQLACRGCAASHSSGWPNPVCIFKVPENGKLRAGDKM